MKYALKIIHKAQKDLDSIKGKDFNFIKKRSFRYQATPGLLVVINSSKKKGIA